MDWFHEIVAWVLVTPLAERPDGGEGASVSAEKLVASSTSTQSPSPSAFSPGGVKASVPRFANSDLVSGGVKPFGSLFAKGPPESARYLPMLGSHQRAFAGLESFVMSTVIVRRVGTYAITSAPSIVRAAVT